MGDTLTRWLPHEIYTFPACGMEHIIFTKYHVTREKCDEKRASHFTILPLILFKNFFSVMFLSFRSFGNIRRNGDAGVTINQC